MLNQKWLKTFQTLVDTQHFTKTAEKLYMTQPGVSQHITKLEEQLNCQLIIRLGKRFELTEHGTKVYLFAKKLFLNELQLLEQLEDDNHFSGECSISMSGSLCQLIYPELIALQAQHPALNISVESAPEHKIYQQLQDNDIGFGLVTGQNQQGRFDFEKLGEEQICLLGSAELFPDNVSDDELKNTPVIHHPDVLHYLNLIFDHYSTNIKPEKLIRGPYINQIDQILLPVSKGLGFTALPIHALESSKYGKSVKILNEEQLFIQNVYLVKKQNRPLPRRYEELVKVIRKCINK